MPKESFREFATRYNAAWNAHDVLFDAHPTYTGRPGSIGDRGGNFVVQNSDCLLVLGSRLNIRQVSYDWKKFARRVCPSSLRHARR